VKNYQVSFNVKGTKYNKEVKMVVNVTDANFKQEVLKSDIPVLVDFWAEWCMPCKMVAPAVDMISSENPGTLKVCKLNVDEGQRTATEYDVRSIPTLAVFKKGKLVDKRVGAFPKEGIVDMVSPHL
jgi:thioredoxin 1